MTTIQKVPAIIKRAVRTGCNVKLTGHPGIGKTQIIEQTAASLHADNTDFGFWPVYTPSMSPLDFVAVAPDYESKKLTRFVNEGLPNAYDNPNQVGIVFLGEVDNADPSTNKVLLKYINGEDLGGLRKPKGVIVVSDSNCLGHKSGVIQQPLSLISRSRNINVECDPDEVLKYFSDVGIHPMVQAYLLLRKEHVDTFAKTLEARVYGSWANPRAWERLSTSMIDADTLGEVMTDDEIIGDIGDAVGREFIGFLNATRVLVTMEKILKSPEKAKMPTKMSDIYAVIAMVASSSKVEHMEAIRIYVSRYDLEVQVLYHRLLVSNKAADITSIGRSGPYMKWMKENPALTSAIIS